MMATEFRQKVTVQALALHWGWRLARLSQRFQRSQIRQQPLDFAPFRRLGSRIEPAHEQICLGLSTIFS
jgi:hypothetical protein